jgi:uncharacterized SAM-binding protein YcdF (DUF218 family)
MFFILSKILDFLIDPIFWIFTFLILSLSIKNSFKKRLFLKLGVFSFIFFTSPLPIHLVSNWWDIKTPSINDIKGHYSVGVVLGGFTKTVKKEPTTFYLSESADRIIKAVQLYKKGTIKKIFISGGSGRVLMPHFEEGKITADFLKTICIDSLDILQENKSKNTYQNALFTKQMLDSMNLSKQPILLITSKYHLRRSIACFKKVGLLVVPFSCDPTKQNDIDWLNLYEYLLPTIEKLKQWNIYLHEIVGYIIYKLNGYL